MNRASIIVALLGLIVLPLLGACNYVEPCGAPPTKLSLTIKPLGDVQEIPADGRKLNFIADAKPLDVTYKWQIVGKGNFVDNNDSGRTVQYEAPATVSKQEQVTITVTATHNETKCLTTADITFKLVPDGTIVASNNTSTPTSAFTSTPTSTNGPTSMPTSSLTSTPIPTGTPTPLASPPPLGFVDDLDDDSTAWDISIDPPAREATAKWESNNVPSPGRTGNALRVAILGGEPYTDIHAYSTLPPEPKATAFRLELWWRFSDTTFNNQGRRSRVQAVELTTSKWQAERRYEWALQWLNVADKEGGRAPTWRLWNGSAWIDTGIDQRLAPEQWHHFTLQGDITADGQVRYVSFTSDDVVSHLGQTFAPSQGDNKDRITVAFQLDGNAREDPYECLFDSVRLEWFATKPW